MAILASQNSAFNHPRDNGLAGGMFVVGAAAAAGLMLPLGKTAAVTLPTSEFLAIMCAAGVVLGLPVILFERQQLLNSRGLKCLVIHGTAAFIALSALWSGVSLLHPATVSFLGNSQVLFSWVIGLALLGERFSTSMVIASLIIVSGVVVSRWSASINLNADNLGVALTLGAAVSFSLADWAIKRFGVGVPMGKLILVRNVFLCGAFALWTAWHSGFAVPTTSEIVVGVACGGLGMVVSRMFFNAGLQRLSLVQATMLFQVAPVFALGWSLLIQGTLPQTRELIGGLTITVGAMILLAGRRRMAT